MTRHLLIFGLILASVWLTSCSTPPPPNRVVRVAVIGGMMKTGLWPELARRFEADTGYKTELAMAGVRELIADTFREGKADLLTMHSGDITTDLVADGYGTHMRPWAHNEFVIVGPRTDPAGIRSLRDGAAALERIAKAQAPFVDFQDIGSRELTTKLWKKTGLHPQGSWLLKDESDRPDEVTAFAQEKGAYVIIGRIPALKGYMPMEGLEILVEGDPIMRRPYIVLEANPKKFSHTNVKGARALSDYFLSDKTQNFLLHFGTNSPGGVPLFYPVNRP